MKIEYTLTLLSDAEPGTGTGGAIVNQRIPRDGQNRPYLPAAHIKGLLREELALLESIYGGITDLCLGAPGQNGEMEDGTTRDRNGIESLFRLTEARTNEQNGIRTDFVTRTAIDPQRGRANDKSLRTVENIAAGTVFKGKIFSRAEADSLQDLALRLALLSLGAIGGNRNRGSGACKIDITGEDRSPGTLLQLMKGADKTGQGQRTSGATEIGTETVLCRLIFQATGPICCPETPVRAGAIRSGFAIPPSAVQGMILHQLALSCSDHFVTQCYESESFRAWPLLPCAFDLSEAPLPVPVRVSLTHKVAKLVADGQALTHLDVTDQAIEVIDWTQVQGNNPLKAQDGVLLVGPNKERDKEEITLWRARSMPHRLSAHGVHSDPNRPDSRNLYQVDAMEPLIFSGFVLMPKSAYEIFVQSIEQDACVSFGRGRSVRGQGTLSVSIITDEEKQYTPWSNRSHDVKKDGSSKETEKVTLMILQSPVKLDDQPPVKLDDQSEKLTANEELAKIVKDSWKYEVEAVGATTGIVFGWNRHAEKVVNEKQLTGKGNRLRATRVLLPGSIFRFKEPIDGVKIKELVQKGLGDGREQGFGAVSVHPGMATKLFDSKPKTVKEAPSPERDAVRACLNIWNGGRTKLPSASQINAVRERLETGNQDQALAYLDHQTQRTERIWATWEPIKLQVEDLIRNHRDHASLALKMLADLSLSEGSV